MQSFFSCFACESKIQNVITPVKQVGSTAKKRFTTEEQVLSEFERTKTITTLTFQKSQQNEDEEQITKKIQNLMKKPIDERKQLQSEFIKRNMGTKDLIYFVEKKWSQEYTYYLQNSNKETMRQINNKVLLTGSNLSNGLREKIDYFLVSKKIWIFISKLYGGGPQLKKDTHLPTFFVPVSGIKNNKYFCYLNTGIQCLLSIPEFVAYFRNKVFRQIKYDTKHNKKEFSEKTSKLIKLFEQKPNEIKILDTFSEMFQEKFDRRLQHDCQQFLRYYLQILQEELNPFPLQKVTTPKNSEEAYINYRLNHQSIIDNLFAGQFSNFIRCLNCENISICYDPFLDLSIEIGKDSLEGNLNKYFMQEKLNDLYQCERCHIKSKATKQLYISKSPLYLLISFKRFLGNKKKYIENISYPAILNIEQYLKGHQNNFQYNLQSIIIHRGSIDKGHYYCLTKRGNNWYYINDETFKQVKIEDHMGLEAYMLIYQKRKI